MQQTDTIGNLFTPPSEELHFINPCFTPSSLDRIYGPVPPSPRPRVSPRVTSVALSSLGFSSSDSESNASPRLTDSPRYSPRPQHVSCPPLTPSNEKKDLIIKEVCRHANKRKGKEKGDSIEQLRRKMDKISLKNEPPKDRKRERKRNYSAESLNRVKLDEDLITKQFNNRSTTLSHVPILRFFTKFKIKGQEEDQHEVKIIEKGHAKVKSIKPGRLILKALIRDLDIWKGLIYCNKGIIKTDKLFLLIQKEIEYLISIDSEYLTSIELKSKPPTGYPYKISPSDVRKFLLDFCIQWVDFNAPSDEFQIAMPLLKEIARINLESFIKQVTCEEDNSGSSEEYTEVCSNESRVVKGCDHRLSYRPSLSSYEFDIQELTLGLLQNLSRNPVDQSLVAFLQESLPYFERHEASKSYKSFQELFHEFTIKPTDKHRKKTAKLISKDLYKMDICLFKQLRMVELIKCNWRNPNEDCLTVKAITDHFNKVTHLIIDQILNSDEKKEVASEKIVAMRICFFLLVSEVLIKKGSFSTTMAINAALNNVAISRLEHIWKRVFKIDQIYKLLYRNLSRIGSFDKNCKILRKEIGERASRGKKVIPYLGIYQRDFLSAYDGIEGKTQKGNYNIEKLVVLSQIIEGLSFMQQRLRMPKIHYQTNLFDLISQQPAEFLTDNLDEKSLKLLPKKNHQIV